MGLGILLHQLDSSKWCDIGMWHWDVGKPWLKHAQIIAQQFSSYLWGQWLVSIFVATSLWWEIVVPHFEDIGPEL